MNMTTQPLRFGMKAAVTVFFAVMNLTAMWSQQATISGRITTLFGQGLDETTVEVTSASGTSYFELTDGGGYYSITVPTGDSYTVKPNNSLNPLYGVSTFDLVYLGNYLSGEFQFFSPFQIIAADVNGDNQVNGMDSLLTRQLIVGTISTLPNTGSWRFVPVGYEFPDPQSPFPFPESISINNLSGDVINRDFWAIKAGDLNFSVDIDSLYNRGISGRIRIDSDNDCIISTGEQPLEDWTIVANGPLGAFYGTTSENGNYAIYLPSGTYDVWLNKPNNLWAACVDTLTGIPAMLLDTATSIDFSVQAVADCPKMDVDIAASFLRRCFQNYYGVHYCNNGTVTAENAYVEIQFDSFLTVMSSSLPWSSVNGNTYTFDLGDVAAGDCGYFNVIVSLSCDAVLGQTHCTEAHIYPDSLCAPVPALWNGANLEVSAVCQDDEVTFTITNTGSSMTAPLDYIVIEDIMIQMTGGTILLDSGEVHTISVPANGSTWRLEMPQVPGNPWNTFITAAIEGCGENAEGTFSLGFLTQYPENEYGGYTDIDCRQNVGAFDPNDKQGFPTGVFAEHYIPQGTEIEYLIRFQNTGTDTAFNIVILDTLSPSLDWASLRPGGSSHPYNFSLAGPGVAQFVFQNIMLPDSNINEPASHGFVKFAIKPRKGLPNLTTIENDAAIYFDFNEPVITNSMLHTVGEQYLSVSGSALRPGIELAVFPNPTATKAVFSIQSRSTEQGMMYLYNLQGRQVRTQPFSANTFEFDATGLVPGVYLFRLDTAGGALAAGKLVVAGKD